MNDLMTEAARLTRGGDLRGAMTAIQRALAGGADAHRTADGVIDVVARVVEPAHDTATAAPPRPDSVTRPESWTHGQFSHQGRSIQYRLFVPATVAPARQPALVVMLHGCTQDAEDFARGTQMNARAAEAGVMVLYPEQTQRANAQRCWNWFKTPHQQRGRGEPALLAALTQHIVSTQGADPCRVYAAGLSAGGAMADILGRTYPDVFAAVGVHSGLPAGAASDIGSALAAMRQGSPTPPRAAPSALPTIVFHGDADATVHPRNGQAVVDVALAARDGAAPAPERTEGRSPQGRRFTRTRYAGADGGHGGTVEHWQLHGTGHAWSGGSSLGSYTDGPGVDASAEMLRFFLAHARQNGQVC